MKYLHTSFLISILSLVACNTHAGTPKGSAYIDGEQSRVGLILCHGRGKHPKWKVVDPLRKSAHKQLGFHTLSLQMPAEKKLWKKYAEDFPEAINTIQADITFLKEEKALRQST